MIVLFDMAKQLLTDAVSYPEFVAANSVLQDQVTLAQLQARIAALKPS